MKDLITDGRLIPFSDDEKALLKGSIDFYGVNHYYSKYVHYTGIVGDDFDSDPRSQVSDTNKSGHLIGPYADSSWLTVYPPGFGQLLEWISNRYNSNSVPTLYVFENGVSVPNESNLPVSAAIHDQFRINYYNDYINEMGKAIE